MALRALTHRMFVVAAFGALVLAACQGSGLSLNPSALGGGGSQASVGREAMEPLGLHSYPPGNWQSYTVNAGDNTLLTGVSNNGGDGNSDMYLVSVSYPISTLAYTSYVQRMPNHNTTTNPHPTPEGTAIPEPSNGPGDIYLAGDGDNPQKPYIFASGYVSSSTNCPSPGQSVPCGFIYDPSNNTKSYLEDPKEGTVAGCGGTFLSKTNDVTQVGYYQDSSCHAHAIEEYSYHTNTGVSSPQWIEFPSSSLKSLVSCGNVVNSWAYGTNDQGFVVGAFTTSTTGANCPSYIGWRYKAFHYSLIQYQATAMGPIYPTVPEDVGFDGNIVGYYLNGTTKHGFQNAGTSYATEDYPSTTALDTVVYGYNDFNYMVGAYRVDSGGLGVWHGFIAQCACGSTTTSNDLSTDKPTRSQRKAPGFVESGR